MYTTAYINTETTKFTNSPTGGMSFFSSLLRFIKSICPSKLTGRGSLLLFQCPLFLCPPPKKNTEYLKLSAMRETTEKDRKNAHFLDFFLFISLFIYFTIFILRQSSLNEQAILPVCPNVFFFSLGRFSRVNSTGIHGEGATSR